MHDDAQVALSVCAHISRMVRSSAGKPTVWCSVKATSPMDLRSSAGPAHGRPLGLMQRVDAKFSDGALSVDLSPLRDVDLALPTITRVLNVRAGGGDSVSHLVVDALRTRNELLVLDAAGGLAELLSSCPGLKLLATSREPSGSRLGTSASSRAPRPKARFDREADSCPTVETQRVSAWLAPTACQTGCGCHRAR
jgi:hypothetical protein